LHIKISLFGNCPLKAAKVVEFGCLQDLQRLFHISGYKKLRFLSIDAGLYAISKTKALE
jgi:hypothetical protein